MWVESQAVCKDPRTVAAGGGSELEVARQLAEHGRKETGLEQYAYAKFAEALEVRSSHVVLCVCRSSYVSMNYQPPAADRHQQGQL